MFLIVFCSSLPVFPILTTTPSLKPLSFNCCGVNATFNVVAPFLASSNKMVEAYSILG